MIWGKGQFTIDSIYATKPNKCIKKEFVISNSLVFPNGLFFEDMLFHMSVIAKLESFSISYIPTFTYFRRYGRPQITSGSGMLRFDAIATAFITLDVWSKTSRHDDKKSTSALLLSLFKLLKWCEESVSHIHRYHFHQSLIYNLNRIDKNYLYLISSSEFCEIVNIVDWGADVLNFIELCVSEVQVMSA